MTQELILKPVSEIQPDERCLIELGARTPDGISNYYAVLKITRINKDRYLLRVRGSDGQTNRMFVHRAVVLAVVSEALDETFLTL